MQNRTTTARPAEITCEMPGRAGGDGAIAASIVARSTLGMAEICRARSEAAAIGLALDVVLARSHGVEEAVLARLCADAEGQAVVDPVAEPPDPRLLDRLGATEALRLGVLPWRRVGGRVLVATSRPAHWPRNAPVLERLFGPVIPVVATEAGVQAAVAATRGRDLRLRAEARVPRACSARGLASGPRGWLVFLGLLALVAGLVVLAPTTVLAFVLGWLILALAATTVLRGAAVLNALQRPASLDDNALPHIGHLPVVSILVPLYGEPDIAPRLLHRIGRLDYPRALLDVVLVLEENDSETRAALAACRLPGWMRIVTVPGGTITTKPRAMNYALDFCRGSIIGIYYAEDAPDPDQLIKVVRRFAERGPHVACLQGVLDYYNPRTNLMSRLFTAEYSAWFRVVMPMLQRLGVPMPLGGTTLFIRREALERVGAWDAHNVTEDADLGVRLARHGLRTEMIDTTTHEEANCRARPWIRQRSRWIKGHLMTWAVHMRTPVQLWRDLGWQGFLGYQVVFIGAQSQVLLAPLMWSFWLIPAGVPHPVSGLLPAVGIWGIAVLFAIAELLVMATAAIGLRRGRHKCLGFWVPLLHVYHPLGALAGWRAVWECFSRPFYWAKTSHGHFDHVLPVPATARQSVSAPVPEQRQAQAASQQISVFAPRPQHDEGLADLTAPKLAAPGTMRAAVLSGPDETAAVRLRKTLDKIDPALALPDTPVQPTRNSPASSFSRVSKAREMWVRNAS